MGLNIARIREILSQINADQKSKDLYESKFHRTVTYLAKSCGLTVARISRPGVVFSKYPGRKNDLDLVFSTSPEKKAADVYGMIQKQFQAYFGKTVTFTPSPEILHMTMPNVELSLDFIVIPQTEFDKLGVPGLRDIAQFEIAHLDAMKIVKYAADKAGLTGKLGHGIIEKAVFKVEVKDVVVIVEKSIFSMAHQLQKFERTPDQLVKYLK